MAEVQAATPGTTSSAPAWRYEEGLKDPAVEEPIDVLWHRRVGFHVFVKPLEGVDARYRYTPTQMTIASLLTGLAGATAYWFAGDHGVHWYAVGSLLVLTSVALDSGDGMLARYTRTSSEIGMLLDGLVDFVVGFAVWLGLARSALISMNEWWAWPSVILLWLSIMVHVAYYDHFKNIFVRLCMPKAQRPARKPPAGSGMFMSAVAKVYTFFYGGTSRIICGEDIEHLDHVEHDVARRELMPTMRYTAWLGIGLHFFIMYMAALANIFFPTATLWAGFGIISVVLSIWMIITVVTQRRAARRLRFGTPTPEEAR